MTTARLRKIIVRRWDGGRTNKYLNKLRVGGKEGQRKEVLKRKYSNGRESGLRKERSNWEKKPGRKNKGEELGRRGVGGRERKGREEKEGKQA
jgi:hypothetical protein